MKEEDKTKEQLIDEIKTLRTRLTELEASETYWRGAQKSERPYSRRLRALPKIVHTLAQPMVFQKKVFHVVQQLVYALEADAAVIRMADQERKELPLLVTAETAPSPSYYTPAEVRTALLCCTRALRTRNSSGVSPTSWSLT